MQDSGFSIEEGVLSRQECQALTAGMEDRIERSRAGARHLMSHPVVASLARDERMLSIARRVLGGQAMPFRATLFEKSPRSNWLVTWHQDTALPLRSYIDSAEWGPWSTKAGVLYAHAPAWALNQVVALRLHLNPCTADCGPLRVLPGSHHRGVMSDEEIFKLAHMQTPIDCLVGRGGVLAMRPLVVHASSKATGDAFRCVLHLEYAVSLELYSAKLALA